MLSPRPASSITNSFRGAWAGTSSCALMKNGWRGRVQLRGSMRGGSGSSTSRFLEHASAAKPHGGKRLAVSASSSRTAVATRAMGSVIRQSELLLPPQPLM